MDDEWKLPWEGGCRCGALRFRVTKPPLMAGACHCRGCQRMTGSAYALTMSLNADGFEVLQGEPVLGGLKAEPKHYHCAACLSWVYTKPTSLPWLVNLRTSMLDDPHWATPYIELFREQGFAWASTGAKHSYATGPADDEFPRLMAEYAKEGARP
jgi:hypothetical protein